MDVFVVGGEFFAGGEADGWHGFGDFFLCGDEVLVGGVVEADLADDEG